ncbi:NAD(P)/FAD-dependent oxidoreductase [Gallaecimonas kandeliae]|uniref:NAD(P)/FAD-dependent oxidoreductase n=1 Tax=Gallaecimonas kandeliae TaxID=3029055 RepID=UPI0026482E0A|nr:NAD(P)/FAD-dependent oxidoreductase [Gallaecimonas kandeliae]WKE63986.1 NAD(P)/FAD-dependent oxidoreductase [Gallaecimonas kandeliae]
MTVVKERVQVLVIGAGPAGVLAATLLHRAGIGVRVLEKARFPRFSIGESLLPQSMAFLAEAGLLKAVNQAGFQYKEGAAFGHQGRYVDFDFRDKFSPGPGTTFQVKRAQFDKLLADEALKQGVDIRFGQSIEEVDLSVSPARIWARGEDGEPYQLEADFVLDASGFGRVLPRLLDLEIPSGFEPRQGVFTHVVDNASEGFDRDKILISVHPEHKDVWYWLIPFSDGTSSLGVVASQAYFEGRAEQDNEALLKALTFEEPGLAKVLAQASFEQPVNCLKGYSAKVSRLCGPGFALLGNAGEFLDPVFSSGVTIAFKSASLAAQTLVRQFKGETVDWQADFAAPLQAGVDVFRTYVEGWYEGSFQDVIFYPEPQPQVKQMVCSILAGYVWDKGNPFVAESRRRLRALAEICRPG